LDRLVWADGISFVSHGVRVGVRVNDPRVMEQVVERFPPEWKPSRSPVVDILFSIIAGGESPRTGVRRFNLAYCAEMQVARTRDFSPALDRFESNLQLYVAALSKRKVFVHAGVVGWGKKAIVIPGVSHSGKTSLVRELVKAGATYYSDEYAVLDDKGRVHPFPKPLGIRVSGSSEQKRVRVEEFGGIVGIKPLPVGLVVLSKYIENGCWRPRRISPGRGVLGLLANTVPAQLQPDRSLAALQRVVEIAPVVRSSRGEAAETARQILSSLS
jgi:hypothetical protein